MCIRDSDQNKGFRTTIMTSQYFRNWKIDNWNGMNIFKDITEQIGKLYPKNGKMQKCRRSTQRRQWVQKIKEIFEK